jgi:ribosomal protein S18 acetylase RimI-like enzyme/CelD/BcsL family acetyltransferase involved in cellulose biosynthesis
MIGMRCEILHDAEAFRALGPAWDALCASTDAGLFLSHRWLSAWWRAYRGVDELWVLVLRDGEELVAAWPLHLRAPRSGPIKIAELRLLGDLGGAQRSLLCRPGDLEPAVGELFDTLGAERGWDVLEVPVTGQRVADAIEKALAQRGVKSDRAELPGRAYADLPAITHWDEFLHGRPPSRTLAGALYEAAPAAALASRALDELLRLLRKEWAAREAASPASDPQAVQFLHEVVPDLVGRGLARVGLLRLEGAGVIAADLVVRDRDRHVQLLRGADPEHLQAGAVDQLTLASLKAAVEAGARRFEFAPADEDTPLKTAIGRVTRVRAWNTTAVGRLHRGVTSLKGAVKASTASDALKALDRLRAGAPDVVQRAMARVASYATLHLYRGELFTRDVREPDDLTIRLFGRADFDALSEAARDEFATRLDLQAGYCRQKWERGDTVVLAEVSGRPAGIVWCARTAVYVPDIGREVRPGAGECYIHDVYVHPDQRGRQVAPAMLDFLARELRARDVYRAWALIERSNTASTRAFEKAAYASVADVVYARMGLASRLIVRPPDPEARAFLGLP